MTDLSKMTIPQLALALTGEPRLPMNEVLAECRRRQAMLGAAEKMADVLKMYEWCDQSEDCSFGCCQDCGEPEFKPHRPSCDWNNSRAAYAAAKGEP